MIKIDSDVVRADSIRSDGRCRLLETLWFIVCHEHQSVKLMEVTAIALILNIFC